MGNAESQLEKKTCFHQNLIISNYSDEIVHIFFFQSNCKRSSQKMCKTNLTNWNVIESGEKEELKKK